MRFVRTVGAALLLTACAAGAAAAQEAEGRIGGRERYDALCAACHGPDGAGDGPVASSLKVPPPDLRRIAERNGRFDRAAVAAKIDGRTMAGAHGSEQTPIWGRMRLRARKGDIGPSPAMLQLLAFLESIQVAP